MRSRRSFAVLAMAALAFSAASSVSGKSPQVTTVVYDDFSAAGGYSLTTYGSKWSNIYGLGDMGAGPDTRDFSDGTFAIADAPFRTSFDYSVFDHLKYIAITGTNGKTTTTAIAAHLLKSVGARAVAAGNIGTPLSDVALQSAPPDWVALEMSSYQLHFTPSIHPNVGAVTNVSPNHLDRYRSTEEYYGDKTLLFRNSSAASSWVTL